MTAIQLVNIENSCIYKTINKTKMIKITQNINDFAIQDSGVIHSHLIGSFYEQCPLQMNDKVNI